MAPSLSASQCTSPMQDAAPAAAGAGDQGLGAMHAAAPQQHLAGGGANHTHTAKQPASFWDGVAQAPPEPILGLSDAYRADPDPRKLNLGVGVYRTEEGQPLVLQAVRQAEQRLVSDFTRHKDYQPMSGNPAFCALAQRLAFGADFVNNAAGRSPSPAAAPTPMHAPAAGAADSAHAHANGGSGGGGGGGGGCIATVQTLSGTGALRVGAEFLARHHPVRIVYLSQPTWAPHVGIFAAEGLEVRWYRYFDPATKGLDYKGMLSDLSQAPAGSVVVLHACAHNPTGVDPSSAQWRGVLQAVQERQLLPFFDCAYQGFASGDVDQDAAALRLFAHAGQELLLAQSFAKNMGLYGERVGALSVVAGSPDAARRVESQLCAVARCMYSSPPIHGAAVAVEVLADPGLYRLWQQELAGMSGRICDMRTALHAALTEVGAPGNWDHIIQQVGMFSYTGLTQAQCRHMLQHWHVYLTPDGRISMAGLSRARARYLAEAIKDSVLHH